MERLLIALLCLVAVNILVTLAVVQEAERRLKKYIDNEALTTLNVLMNADNIKKKCNEHVGEWIDV